MNSGTAALDGTNYLCGYVMGGLVVISSRCWSECCWLSACFCGQVLDEERVELHLKTLLNLIKEDKFDSMKHTAEVATVTFEVWIVNSQDRVVVVTSFLVPWCLCVNNCCHHSLCRSASLLLVVRIDSFLRVPVWVNSIKWQGLYWPCESSGWKNSCAFTLEMKK